MKRSLSHFATLFLIASFGGLFAVAEPPPNQPDSPVKPVPPKTPDKFDFTQPQSPTKPAPKWLKYIDQGDNDPRLKGYRTPEGVKVEIVADAPTVLNPIGMTFGLTARPMSSNGAPTRGR